MPRSRAASSGAGREGRTETRRRIENRSSECGADERRTGVLHRRRADGTLWTILGAVHLGGRTLMRLFVVTLCALVVPAAAHADPTEDAAVKAVEKFGG